MIILLDTNFLITAIKHKIADQIRGLGSRIAVPETVIRELNKTSLNVMAKKNAAAALILLEKWGTEILPTKIRNVDDSILAVAQEIKERGEEVYIATLDEELKGRIYKKGLKTIGIKREKIVEKD